AEAGPHPRTAAHDVALRALVLRPAHVPVAGLRWSDSAQAEGLPVQDRVQRSAVAGVAVRRPCRRRADRQGHEGRALDQREHRDARDRPEVRTRRTGLARGAAQQDRARSDVRRADAGRQGRQEAAGESAARRAQRRADGRARRDPQHARPLHPAGLPHLAAGPLDGRQGPWARPQQRDRQPARLRRDRRRPLRGAQPAARRPRRARAQHRRDLPGADGEGVAAARAHRELRHGVQRDPERARELRRAVEHLPDVPARVAADLRAPRALRDEHPAGRTRARAGDARPPPHPRRAVDAVARPQAALHEPRPAHHRVEEVASRPARDLRRAASAARRARTVAVGGQPDPRLARPAPAHADRHVRQPRRRDEGDDDVARPARPGPLPAPVLAERRGDRGDPPEPPGLEPRQRVHQPAGAHRVRGGQARHHRRVRLQERQRGQQRQARPERRRPAGDAGVLQPAAVQVPGPPDEVPARRARGLLQRQV
ncbi:MAG: virulence factor Mce family protein, partial [uncultured Solirubrobacteraceae bacterium]